MKRAWLCVVIAAIIIITAAAGQLASLYWNRDAPLAVAVITAAIVSFFGLLAVSQSGSIASPISEADLRTAIAGSLFIMYMLLVSFVAFFQTPKGETDRWPEVSRTMLSNFTTTMGLVVAFYFGSSAAIEWTRRSRPQKEPGTDGHETGDQQITADLKTKFSQDPELKSAGIQVETSGGIVELKGAVGSDVVSAKAADLAKGMKGVKNVINNLT